MEYTKLYIGSNNETNTLELTKIKDILAKHGQLQGYTLITGHGFWENNTELVAIIEIYGSYNLSLIDILKRELKQNSIMVVKALAVVEFI